MGKSRTALPPGTADTSRGSERFRLGDGTQRGTCQHQSVFPFELSRGGGGAGLGESDQQHRAGGGESKL